MTNFNVFDNIFSEATEAAFYLDSTWGGQTGTSGLALDNNLYYQSNGGLVVSWQGTNYDMNHFSGTSSGYYQHDIDRETHSIAAARPIRRPRGQ